MRLERGSNPEAKAGGQKVLPDAADPGRRRCRALPLPRAHLAMAPSTNATKAGLIRDSDTPNQEQSLSQKPVMSLKMQGSREHESVAQKKAPTRPTGSPSEKSDKVQRRGGEVRSMPAGRLEGH